MMTKWRLSITMILGLLICGVGAGFPCKKAEQIHWKSNSTSGKRYKCLDCPDCPGGSQPSVPCGSSVPWGTPVECVFCQLGKTYSDKYDKAQCTACTVCSPGKAVIKNCTLSSNTVCDDKCARGFYPMPFVFTCQPCEECCNDGNDEIAKECANYGKKCKFRSTPCIRVHTTPSKPTTLRHMKSTALPTTQYVMQQSRLQTLLRTKPIIQTSPTVSYQVTGNSKAQRVTVGTEQSVNKILVILAIVGSILAILGLTIFTLRQASRLFRNTNSNNHRNVNVLALSKLAGTSASVAVSEKHLNLVGLTLVQLEKDHQELFDWICLKLDNGRWWFRRDYERLAAKYKDITLEERNALQDELQSKGSPSKMLMSLIQTKYPSLSLCDFIRKLKEIGRNDIAQRLTNHRPTTQTNDSNP